MLEGVGVGVKAGLIRQEQRSRPILAGILRWAGMFWIGAGAGSGSGFLVVVLRFAGTVQVDVMVENNKEDDSSI